MVVVDTERKIYRLHLGCGRTILPGWVNVDVVPGDGIDVVADLDDCARRPLPFDDDSVSDIIGNHFLEHIRNPLPLMQELHRVAMPGAKAVFAVPYGSSDDAYEDPTHVRHYFLGSWGYFSQPYYWRADYGYRGDWLLEKVTLKVRGAEYRGKTPQEILQDVVKLRNVVVEMVAEMKAIKPIREPKRELQTQPHIELSLV